MSEHPTPERLADYAHAPADANDAGPIESHLAACRDCAWLAQRFSIERRRLAEALVCPPPAGLAERILAAGPRASRPRLAVPLAAAAAVAIAAVAALAAHRGRNEALATVRALEAKLAAAPVPPEPRPAPANLWDELLRVEVESSVSEMTAWADLPADRAAPVRDAMLAAASTTAEAFERAARGELDVEELLRTDTLAGLDAELRATLDETQYGAVTERLARHAREAAERTARAFLVDLQSAAQLTDEQRASLEPIVVERSGWRRDVAFVPEFARRHLCVQVLCSGAGLRAEVRERLSSDQADLALRFLEREGAGHRKLWENLTGKS